MMLNLKTKLNLPSSIQTETHLALPINGRRGLCASFFHPDQLDIAALDYAKYLTENSIEHGESVYTADIGCSPYFPQAIRFAQLGLMVDAFDIENPIDEYGSINKEVRNKINYIQTNLKLPLEKSHHNYSIVYSNRFMSHITFFEAKKLLNHFIDHAKTGCRFYLSFGNLAAYESDFYADRSKPIEERYSKMLGERSKQHQWTEPVCLYNRIDIYNKLLKNYPIKILDELEGSVSTKVIFSKE